MKKNLTIALCLLLAAAMLAACGGAQSPAPTEEPQQASMANPMHETDAEGLVESTGISLPAPEYASDVSWSYIELTGEAPIAQMHFTLGDKNAFLRARATDKTDLSDIPDISGLHYNWNTSAEDEVAHCRASVYTNGEAGYIAWLDVMPGVQYCLGMTEGASVLELVKLANQVFVPQQGDAG